MYEFLKISLIVSTKGINSRLRTKTVFCSNLSLTLLKSYFVLCVCGQFTTHVLLKMARELKNLVHHYRDLQHNANTRVIFLYAFFFRC